MDTLEAVLAHTVDCHTREELRTRLAEDRPLRVKLGVDPSSPDLHLGHSVVLRYLRRLQDLGHQAVLVIGDATAMVGDPSGKSLTRPQLTRDQVQIHARTYFRQAGLILDMDRVEVVYNSSWFDSMGFMDAVRLGASMTVARMLERDIFERRYAAGAPIGIHEFLYPLMQARDSVELAADIEIGGTDQTFNLLVGRDLMRDAGLAPQVCITLPLLVGLDGGQKMSKSLGNAVGLTDPPGEMFGKIMSIDDERMSEWFKLLTDVPGPPSAALLAGSPRDTKAELARRLVGQYHGQEAAKGASAEFDRVFRDKGRPDSMDETVVPATLVDSDGVWIARVLTHCGMAGSTSEARRLLRSGGVRVDGAKVADEQVRLPPGTTCIVQVGRRRFCQVSIPS